MEPPRRRVNTFIKIKEDVSIIDLISKVAVASQNLCGLNKMAVLDFMKPQFLGLAFIYAIALNTVLLYFICIRPRFDVLFEIVVSVKILQHLINCFLSFILCKRLRNFYDLIGKFDRKIEATPRVSREQTMIIFQAIVLVIFTAAHLTFRRLLLYLPFHLTYYIETHFYGYLISLLFQRVGLINDYIESPLPLTASLVLSIVAKNPQMILNSVQIPMNKLMDYYQIIESAFKVLTDAIKWQFVAIVATSFLFLLVESLKVALMVINKEKFYWDLLPRIVMPMMELLSLLVPCMCCDLLRAQVRHLRELVASKLYENKLDKSGRSDARTLLALIETSNLSFSLLRVVDVSITLPFTFVGLLITYLVILLQFQKVIDLKV